MNFIKKKIKGSKKVHDDDDDFDPNQFFPSAAKKHPPEGAPKDWVPYEERLDEESEEWQAYKQLTSRISETLQKTQDNLTKIVAHSSVPEGTFQIKEPTTDPPPRPPPPNHNNSTPPPPRPPPPTEIITTSGLEEDENGFNNTEYVFPDDDDDDDDFGIPPLQEDGDDPFDTSFVDLESSIARTLVRARPKARGRDCATDLSIPKPVEVQAKRAKATEEPKPQVKPEADPFEYSDILSTLSTQASRRESLDSTMNPYVPATSRSKSPNPFLSDSPCEPSATNPFLNGSDVGGVDLFSVAAPPTGGATSCGNPFAASVDTNDLFSNVVTTTASAAPTGGGNKRPSLVDELFGMDPLLDPFGDVSTTTTNSATMDLFDLNTEITPVTSSGKCNDAFDIFGATSPPAAAQVSGSRKQSLFEETDTWGVSGGSSDKGSVSGSRRESNDVGGSTAVVAPSRVPPARPPPPVDVFDAFDSVMEPMNAVDGLPRIQPKIRIEIPVELVQNADVFEALGQRGPKTPVEPLTGFDPPTPCPGDDDFYSLESAIVESSLDVENEEETSAEEVDRSEPEVRLEDRKLSLPTLEDQTIVEEPSSKEEDSGVSVSENVEYVDNAESIVESPLKPQEMETQEMEISAFDAFEARFQNISTVSSTNKDNLDPFGGSLSRQESSDTSNQGFGLGDEFDPFLTMSEPPAVPQPSPARFGMTMETLTPTPAPQPVPTTGDEDSDSDDSGPDFSIFIRPKMREKTEVPTQLGLPPVLPPPPKSPVRSPGHAPTNSNFVGYMNRSNPFDQTSNVGNLMFGEEEDETMEVETPTKPQVPDLDLSKKEMERMESVESIGSPLFDEDDTEPLEEFPPKYDRPGWTMFLRQPNKKRITGNRFWKKVFVRLTDHVLHLYNSAEDKDPFQELPLQACYSISEISAQQFDQYGKIFTVKLQYVFYRERVGVRPGQISKVAHGQITSFGQLAKLGLPLEHAPQVSQLLKLGCQDYPDLKVFARVVEDALFRIAAHRDRALTYKTEEIQVTVQDEAYCDVAKSGHVNKQLARVRVFFLAFVSGMPDIEVGLNDLPKKGKEVVGRYDIIPVVTEEWIRLENIEFHSCVSQAEFDKSRTIKFHPPDACFFELLRFRVRPPKVRELPLQVRALLTVEGNRIELRIDVLVPGYSSRKHGQVPCEDISFRYFLPECWIYLFRVEKHFRYGSLKSSARKPGKIKGLERLMGAAVTSEPSLIEVSTGQAKYEHHHRSIVWRVPRLPKEGQGAYTEHSFVCRLELTSYDQMPEELDKYVYVEFTMPASFVSHTTVRSVSVSNQNPPEKHVRYVSKCEYRVEIERVDKFAENVYVSAAAVSKSSPQSQRPPSSASSSSPQ